MQLILKPLLFLYTCYAWLIIVAVFVSHYLVASVLSLFPFKDKESLWYALAGPIVKAGFFLGCIRVKVEGDKNFPNDQNVVVVANHQSLFDIVVLLTMLPKRVVFFAKQELSKVPILAQDIIKMGHVYVDRSQVTKAMEQLLKMEVKLEKNLNVFIFPEGTRSEDGSIAPFKRGAFHLAAKNKKNILPCYIHGANTILRKNSRFIYPGRIKLAIGELIASNYDDQTPVKQRSLELQEKAEKAVRDLQKKLV